MGLWSEWHYTTREIGGWIHNHERVARVIMYPYTNPRVVLCHSDHSLNAFSLLYHTFWCKFTHQHINLKLIYNVTLTSDCLSLALYDNGCSGVLNREHAQRLHVLPSPLLRHLQNAWAKSKRSIEMKSWTVTRVIMWHLCQHGVEASKDWVSVAHFNHLFNTPMPRTVTDVPRSPDVTLLKQAGWYPWAVRLWICWRGPTMYSKLMSRMHCCLQMYVAMHNTFKAPGQWKT